MFPIKSYNTVLVVDDEIGPREALRMILQDKYNVLTCDNPQEAIEIVTSGKVDVVLMDIRMPKMDGLRLLKAMKAVRPEIESVFITAYPNTQSAIEAVHQGAYDYIIKPFDKEKIERVVRKGIIRCTQRRLERNMSSGLMTEFYKKFSKKQNVAY